MKSQGLSEGPRFASATEYEVGGVPNSMDFKIVMSPRRAKDVAHCLEMNTVYKLS